MRNLGGEGLQNVIDVVGVGGFGDLSRELGNIGLGFWRDVDQNEQEIWGVCRGDSEDNGGYFGLFIIKGSL